MSAGSIRFVRIRPGQIAFTLIPSRRMGFAIQRIRPRTPSVE